MRVVNTDNKYHLAKTPEKFLQEAEQAKKNMHLEACLQKRQHLLLFVTYVYGVLCAEVWDTPKKLASHLATNWRQPSSRTCIYINSRITITLVQATHRCIYGYRVPAHKISMQIPQWEDGPGLNLFR